MWRFFTALGLLGFLVACSGRFEYVRPVTVEAPTRFRLVARGVEEVWLQASTISTQHPLTLDGLDTNTGVINLTYSGDPERYVDCGHITSQVTNIRGERIYQFAAGAAAVDYELMTGTEIVSIARRMVLEARIVVTAIPIGRKETQLSVNAQYSLSRTMHVRDAQGSVQTISHLTRFASDQDGIFPGAVVCRARGTLEADVLSAFTP